MRISIPDPIFKIMANSFSPSLTLLPIRRVVRIVRTWRHRCYSGAGIRRIRRVRAGNRRKSGFIVKELVIERRINKPFHVRLGQFYAVAGHLSHVFEPIDFLGTLSSEAKAWIIPRIWHEIRLGLSKAYQNVDYRLLLSNGLQAMAYSAQQSRVVANLKRFESAPATNMGRCVRLDYEFSPGLIPGASSVEPTAPTMVQSSILRGLMPM